MPSNEIGELLLYVLKIPVEEKMAAEEEHVTVTKNKKKKRKATMMIRASSRSTKGIQRSNGETQLYYSP
jgi:hypothetical protein